LAEAKLISETDIVNPPYKIVDFQYGRWEKSAEREGLAFRTAITCFALYAQFTMRLLKKQRQYCTFSAAYFLHICFAAGGITAT
jgi:hypothetical protein